MEFHKLPSFKPHIPWESEKFQKFQQFQQRTCWPHWLGSVVKVAMELWWNVGKWNVAIELKLAECGQNCNQNSLNLFCWLSWLYVLNSRSMEARNGLVSNRDLAIKIIHREVSCHLILPVEVIYPAARHANYTLLLYNSHRCQAQKKTHVTFAKPTPTYQSSSSSTYT